MVSVPMNYLNQGQYLQAMDWVMSDYIGFGILFMFFGVLLFVGLYMKTQSYSYSAIPFIIYMAIVSSRLPPEISKYFLLIIAVMLAIMFIQIYFSKR